MKHTLKLASIALTLALCAALFAACGNKTAAGGANPAASGSTSAPASGSGAAMPAHEPGLFVDDKKVEADPIMTVDGQDVSFDTYRYYYLSGKYRLDGGDESIWTGDKATEAKQALLDYAHEGLLSSFAITAIAKENDIALTDAEIKAIDDEVVALKAQMGGEDAFQQALASQYYTEDVYRSLYTSTKLTDKMLSTVYGDEIRADVLENYVHAQHILVKFTDEKATSHPDELKKAEEILAKVKNGDDFDALMKEYNEDTGEPAEGYYFTTGEMVQEFEDAAFALKDNETSEIVPTSYGYHILRRLPMDDKYVDDNLTQLLSSDMQTKITTDFTEKAKTFAVTYHDNYKKIAPDTLF